MIIHFKFEEQDYNLNIRTQTLICKQNNIEIPLSEINNFTLQNFILNVILPKVQKLRPKEIISLNF